MSGLDPDVIAKELAAPAAPVPQPDPKPAPVAGLSGQDVLTLLERGKRMGVDEAKLQELARTSPSLNDATLAMVDLAAAANPPFGGGRVESGRTEMQKFNLAAEEALCLRGGMRLDKPAPAPRSCAAAPCANWPASTWSARACPRA